MKIFQFILGSIINVLFTSADPNLFGSRKRAKASAKLASELKANAAETQDEIDALKSQNPFESASAKSAMAASARGAKQYSQRFANMMGGGASAESMIAAQGATQGAIASGAGQIATGAEANKSNELASLRGLKSNQTSQYASAKQSAIAEKGSGWTSMFGALGSLGSLAGGAGALVGALSSPKEG